MQRLRPAGGPGPRGGARRTWPWTPASAATRARAATRALTSLATALRTTALRPAALRAIVSRAVLVRAAVSRAALVRAIVSRGVLVRAIVSRAVLVRAAVASLAVAALAGGLLVGAAIPAAADEIPDVLGGQGSVVRAGGGTWVLAKPQQNGDVIVALYNETGHPQRVATSVTEVGLPAAAPAYRVRDLVAGTDTHTAGVLAANVPARRALLLRVGRDAQWSSYPPLVELDLQVPAPYPGGPTLIEPGATAQVTTVVVNHGLTPAQGITATLRAPEGWQATPTGPAVPSTVRAGERLATVWQVRTPGDLQQNAYQLDAAAGRLTAGAYFVVPPAAPTGVRRLSELSWLSMSNGKGAVERGAKDLGAHAPGVVEYYLGRRCTKLTAQVRAGAQGTVTFEVWADGRKVAETETLTGAMPALPINADLTGAALLRLVVTDAGDGAADDQATWGDVVITC